YISGDIAEFILESEHFIVLKKHNGVTWQQARTLCQDSGYELAQPQINVSLLASYLLINHGIGNGLRYYWLGGKGQSINIAWLSGQVIESSNLVWSEGQHDLQNSTDLCVYIRDDGNPKHLGTYNCQDSAYMTPLCEAN
ncbi:unnamed protein product, partial [Meganyctiphanes norvegica]